MDQDFTLAANASQNVDVKGSFFKYKTGVGSITVRTSKGKKVKLTPGQGVRRENFESLTITDSSGGTNTGVLFIDESEFIDDTLSGTVSILNSNGAITNSQKTVANASAQMIAANANRRYLLIQNNDVTGNIYVRLDGAVATVGTGIKIGPGGYYENSSYTPTGAITAIGDIASNTNIVTVEG